MQKEATKDATLQETLIILFQDISHKKIKNYLKGHAVMVNSKIITKYDYKVQKGDTITIIKDNKTHKFSPLPILYEDKEFLVIEKPAGLLSIATDKEKEKTAYHSMREFIKRRGRNEKIFILHRLDKDTSGILVFVKNETLKQQLQNNWNNLVKKREYIAVVEGKMDSISHYTCYLKEDKNHFVHVTSNEKEGKKAITSFEVVKQTKPYTILKVSLKTGRKNQIRVVLNHLSHPIIGDKKYGTKTKGKLLLHASTLQFQHPTTGKIFEFQSKLPNYFQPYIKGKN